ncbi:MAG: radical SAM protein [Thermoplasmatales archaeon]|nr:radical SAM protein [Thermoplasmatales archaeon]MCW6169776.1 radical SAM protein [Thermoplasmatales archaeon]
MHCIIDSKHFPSPDELSLDEIKTIIHELSVAKDISPVIIFTGGDPMLRKDLRQMISFSVSENIRYYVMPSASPLVSGEFMNFLLENNASGIIMSLDGINPKIHDAIRRSLGLLDLTVYLLREAKKHRLRTVVSTTVMKQNITNLPDIAVFLHDLGITDWALIFLVNKGRASSLESINDVEKKAVLRWSRSLLQSGINTQLLGLTEHDYLAHQADEELELKSTALFDFLIKKTSRIIYPENLKRFAGKESVPNEWLEMYVSSNGKVYDSVFSGNMIGDVRRDKFKNLISRALVNESKSILNDLE